MSEEKSDKLVVNLPTSTENTLIFISLGLVCFILSIWFLGQMIGATVAERIDAIGAFGSLAISFALLVAYLLLVNVQEEQLQVSKNQQTIDERLADMQEEQQKYIKANHEPKVIVVSWEISGYSTDYDQLRVTLQNYGNGLAQNLRVRAHVTKSYVNSHGATRRVMVGLSPSSQSQRYEPKISRLSPKNVEQSNTGDFALTAGTDPKSFVAGILIIENDISAHPSGEVPITEHSITEMMEEDPDDTVYQIVFELLYEDVLGNQKQNTFFQSKISWDGKKTFYEMVNERNI